MLIKVDMYIVFPQRNSVLGTRIILMLQTSMHSPFSSRCDGRDSVQISGGGLFQVLRLPQSSCALSTRCSSCHRNGALSFKCALVCTIAVCNVRVVLMSDNHVRGGGSTPSRF